MAAVSSLDRTMHRDDVKKEPQDGKVAVCLDSISGVSELEWS